MKDKFYVNNLPFEYSSSMIPTKANAMYTHADTELLENLEVILSTMRHQLGNSVNGIKVTLDVLKQNFDRFSDVKKKDYLERGSHLLTKQQLLVEAMKSYAGYDVRKQTDIEVTRLWEHISVLANKRLAGTNVALSLKSELGPCSIRGDMMALSKIISCIIENAVDALDAADQPEIDLEAESNESSLSIAIRDNGSGISDSDMARIRVPLFTTRVNRQGMGLSIAHKLLTRMNGQMFIDSDRGKGTCVLITLPTRIHERT